MHPESLRARQLAAPALVLGLGASGVAALLGRRQAALVIPALYTAATLAATAVDLIRRRDAAMLLLPAVYPTMHLAWGTGFLTPGQPAAGPESSEA
jgi:hypothetical protein